MVAADRRFRFAVVNERTTERARWFDHVRRVEQCGVDILLVRDHLAVEPFGPQLAPLPLLAAVATATTRLRLGTMVLDNDYRHPALVAHEAATVDWLSGGRFELGLGAGWLQREYQQMGIPFEAPRRRIARLDEAATVIARLLAGDTVSFRGSHYTIDGLALPTRPVQRPRPPLMLGGGGPRMLALAARHADIVGILPAPIRRGQDSDEPGDRSPASLEAQLAVLRDAAGARFDALQLSLFATFVVTDQRRRDTERLIERRGWQGTTCEQVWAMPSVFIGSAAGIWEDLQARRSRFGLSYYVSSDLALDQLAKVLGHPGAG